MRPISMRLLVFIVIVGAASIGATPPARPAPRTSRAMPVVETAALRIPFIANEGQIAGDVAFYGPISTERSVRRGQLPRAEGLRFIKDAQAIVDGLTGRR